jgi:predicted acyltransferase
MLNRATSIDLLRGFALIMMIFSGMIPFGGVLPAWMYHAQVPPPLHQFNPTIAGLTWVDLVFPFFLFSMGAAIPFALPIKLAKQGLFKTFAEVLRRSIRLLLFAIIAWNFNPLRLPTLGWWASIAGILTYLGLFMAFFKAPNVTNQQRNWVNIGSVVLLASIFIWLTNSDKNIDPSVNDAIIRVLANVYFVGAIVWIITNGVWFLRMAIFLFVMAFYIGGLEKDSWVGHLWIAHDLFNLVSPMLLKYLMIFIPGTIVGDILIIKFIKPLPDDEVTTNEDGTIDVETLSKSIKPTEDTPSFPRSYQRAAAIIYSNIALVATVATLWATSSREMVTGFELILSLGGVGFVSVFFLGSSLSDEELLSKPISEEQFIKIQLVLFGFSLLVMGYFLDPFQGGVKKDSATLSYFFMTSGLATLWILAFHHFTPTLWVSKLLKPVELVGQNALMAYLMAGFLIVPIMNLSYFSTLFIAPSPDQIAVFGVAKAVFITASVVGLTAFMSKKNIFWKI